MAITQYLVIRNPNGYEWKFQMNSDQCRVTLGRVGTEPNDIEIGLNACEHISRRHCLFFREAETGKWWVQLLGKHYLLLRRKGKRLQDEEQIIDRCKLADGDLIRMLGETSTGKDLYWEVQFVDRETTRPVPTKSIFLRYEKGPQILYRVIKGVEERLSLSDMQRDVVDYLLRSPGAVCTHDELIAIAWNPSKPRKGQSEYPTEENLRQLVHNLREKIEPDPDEPIFLITRSGEGYALYLHPLR